MAGKSGREIIAEQPFSWKHLFLRWESMLILLLVAVNIMNIAISDKYWSVTGLFRATNSFLNIAFMVLPMCFVLVLGDIDISVGSILAFSATMLGVTYNAGAPMGVAVLVALLTGTVCGCINGAIATQFTELNPMIITFGTQVVYRGLCEIILGDQSTGGLNNVMWFSNLYWGKIGGVVPYMFVIFVVCAVVFGIVQHKTTFGRRMYAIGANREAARYSGINVQGTRFIVFVLTGLFSAVAAIFTAASMGSINNAISQGVDAIAIAANDADALQPALTEAKNAGIHVLALDSATNAASREVFCNQAGITQVGETLMEAVKDISGGEGKWAILSAASTATNQNAWIDSMKSVMEDSAYSGLELVGVYYGDDEYQKSVDQTDAILSENPDVKVICAPTTVGIMAAAKVVEDKGLAGQVKVTGLGLPSEMADYIGDGDDNSCPYMFLWNPIDLGKLAGYTAIALVNGVITGAEGDSFTSPEGTTYEVTAASDGGTEIILGPPYGFNPENIEEWKSVY